MISTLQGPRVGRIAVDDTFDEVDAAIDTGAVGFRETQDDSGEPATSAADLLPKALERASG